MVLINSPLDDDEHVLTRHIFFLDATQARTYQRAIPMIAHQRMSPVAPPPLYSANRLSALYADAMEPVLIQVVPRYNPASYLEDTFASSIQVSYHIHCISSVTF